MINATNVYSLKTSSSPDWYAHPLLVDLNSIQFYNGHNSETASYASFQFDQYSELYNPFIDRFVERVNWIKMKTLTVGYQVPNKIFKKRIPVQTRLFWTAENLFTLTNYSGLDPETVSITNGLDKANNYPLARKFSIGLTIKL